MSKSDEGVSPVVGVMLMLSVTVIIAAIVSGAAGGLSGSKENAPSAILDVHFYENRSYNGFYADTMTIEHVSGSPLQTKDLSITTYFRNTSGQMIKGYLVGERSVTVDSGQYCGVLFINDQDRFPSTLQDADHGYGSWFGNASAVLMAGDSLVTPAQYYGTSHENSALNDILNIDTGEAGSGYKAGAVITVKIVHIPSGQVIFDKDVVVV
jgi:archaeal type IV pilus assembly protein PilA